MKYTSDLPPIPWRADHDLTMYDNDRMYSQDSFSKDRWAPDGFIDDFQAHTLGYETTNLIAFWSAVHGLSANLKRAVSLHFGSGLYPNFFILIVAPPAVVHKSTALNLFDKVERTMWDSMKNKSLVSLQKPRVVRGKATPEQLFETMSNKTITTKTEDVYESDANLILRISELSVFLSKAQYNQTLIDRLTDFYDCKDVDTDNTIARGDKELKNIFATLFGCTTPDAFKNSIPETAFGGGFMSRCTIVQETYTHRIIPIPYTPKEAPDKEEMAERMRWLFTYKRGKYQLSKEAFKTYAHWYREDALKKRKAALEPNADHREGRKSDIVLKLATLLSAQRYDMSKVVTEADFVNALAIIEYTNKSSIALVEDVATENSDDGRFIKFRRLVRETPEGLTRVQLARVHRFKKEEIDRFIIELKERGEYLTGSSGSRPTIKFKEQR